MKGYVYVNFNNLCNIKMGNTNTSESFHNHKPPWHRHRRKCRRCRNRCLGRHPSGHCPALRRENQRLNKNLQLCLQNNVS